MTSGWQADDMSWPETTADFLRGEGIDVSTDELAHFHSRPQTPDGAVWMPDVVYGRGGGKYDQGGGEDLRMLAYARDDRSEPRPAVIMMHGGGWRSGVPQSMIRNAAHLAAAGYVAASIEYRFAPDHRWPAALEDCKCAVRFLRANAEKFGVDPRRIAIAGGSAGGHLAAMVALTPGRFEGGGGHSEQSSAVQAAVLWSPATDLHMLGAIPEVLIAVKDFLGDFTEKLIAEASPIEYVCASSPPMTSISGDIDDATPLPMVKEFHDKLTENGVRNEIVVELGGKHASGLLPGRWEFVFEHSLRALEEYLG